MSIIFISAGTPLMKNTTIKNIYSTIFWRTAIKQDPATERGAWIFKQDAEITLTDIYHDFSKMVQSGNSEINAVLGFSIVINNEQNDKGQPMFAVTLQGNPAALEHT